MGKRITNFSLQEAMVEENYYRAKAEIAQSELDQMKEHGTTSHHYRYVYQRLRNYRRRRKHFYELAETLRGREPHGTR